MPNSEAVPSLFDTLMPKSRTDTPLVSQGDCGIILRPNGEVEVFSTGLSDNLSDPAKWGEDELKQIEMGKKMMAVSVALQNDQVMSILYDIAAGIIEPGAMRNAVRH